MKKSSLGILAFFIAIIFTACEFEQKTKKSHSIGQSSEILVVTNNKEQWNSMIGDTISDYFYTEMRGMPQPEPMFTLVNIPQEAFNAGFKKNRNIFIVNIDPDLDKAQIETKKDLWAAPQRVIKLTAPDKKSFVETFEENKETFLELFLRVERERVVRAFKTAENNKTIQALKESFGIYLTLPNVYRIAKRTEDFMWIRKETLAFSQGLLIYEQDYTDTTIFDPRHIIKQRNKITRTYIPGPSDTTHMSVSTDFVPPVFSEVNLMGNYAVETRGLWEVEGDFMGGPFVSYTFVNEQTNKVITIDAYVYAPNEEKRDLLRQLEAIIYTLEFVENKNREKTTG